jgi:hypothetical protein
MAKPAAARQRTHKNAKAKISRHATAQSHQKTATINTAPTHRAIIYVASAFGLRSCLPLLVAKHFLLHFIFYHN